MVVHRLLAVSEWGLDAIRGREVHHKNEIPWDNRPENLELVTREEHGEKHRIPTSELMEDLLAGAVALGRPPKSHEYDIYGEYSPTVFIERFGSWEKTLQVAGMADDPTEEQIAELYFREGVGE